MALSHLSPTGNVHHGIVSTCPTCTRPELNTARWQRARASARHRDHGTCRMTDPTCAGTLSVHHIQRGGTDELENLITLCRHHHEQAERDPRFFEHQATPHSPRFREKESGSGERTISVG